MPRVPRHLVLKEGYQAHKVWRSHNEEWNVSSSDEKDRYMEELNRRLSKQENKLHAFTVMSSHVHEQYSVENREEFSKLMRDHHAGYAMYFNKKHKRRGRVAYDRPRTCSIESDEYAMRATFYIHANPIRAGITKDAARYIWSTHRLYAFGKRDKYTRNVVFPEWYMALGKTWKERQRKYRQLFDAYLRECGLIRQDFLKEYFYGSLLWKLKLKEDVKRWIKSRCKDPPNNLCEHI